MAGGAAPSAAWREEFRERGTTILLVSHAVEAVRENCRRAIWLDKGRIEAAGPADEGVERFLAFSAAG